MKHVWKAQELLDFIAYDREKLVEGNPVWAAKTVVAFNVVDHAWNTIYEIRE